MKNRLFLFCLLAALAVSCVKDQQEVIQLMTDDQEFYATIEEPGEPDTRVYANDQLRVRWDAGDHISIFNKTTYNREYAFQGETGDNSGSFKKVPNDDFFTGNDLDYIYAVYPYQESTKISDDGELTFILPAEQSYRENSFGLGANTMISVTEDNELHFKNLCGYFAIKLYGDNVSVKSISIKGNNNELLAGKATVIAQTDAAPTLQMSSAEATKELTLTCSTPVTLGSTAETATTFWFVIPPTTFANGFTLTVKDDKNGEFVKTTSGSLEIKRNTLKKSAALRVEIENQQPQNCIYYTSTDGNIVTPFKTTGFGATLISNEYKDGSGIMIFDNDVTSIGELSFSNCNSLMTLTIPESVTSISHNAFHYCTCLTSITMPKHMTLIGDYAFCGCSSLTSFIMPEGIKSIAHYAFDGCSSLTSIIIPETATSIGEYAFANCSSLKSVIIPHSITSILSHAFFQCNSLTSIIIPGSVREILPYAFANCSNLRTITLSEGMTSIGDYLFWGCTNLSSITIPKGVTSIGEYSFRYCTNLTSVSIPDSIKSIGEGAFNNCERLTTVIIPNSVTNIGAAAFCWCSALSSVTLPESITSLSNDLFAGCGSLLSITIPKGVTTIGESAFASCSTLSNLTIPENVTTIGDSAFRGCTSLTFVSIPKEITQIGNYMFYGCSNLVTISLTKKVTSIGDYAFAACSGLRSITIPEKVTTIGRYAFSGCSSLESITVEAITPPDGGDQMFYGTNNSTIYVPAESVEAYKSAQYWSNYANRIQAMSKPNNKIYYTSTDGNIVTPYNAEGFGANLISNEYVNGQGIMTFDGEVTSIGEYAFAGCSTIASITLPDMLTNIGRYAFMECSHLEHVSIPPSMNSIPPYAFYGCSGLSSIDLPPNVTLIDEYAFGGCSSLTSIDLTNILEIKSRVFYECSSLTSVVIPDGVKYIGLALFYGCLNLTSVIIPDSVESIGDNAFQECSSLTSITIPKGVWRIGGRAFYDCPRLQKVFVRPVTPPQGGVFMLSNNPATIYVPKESLYQYKTDSSWSSYADRIQPMVPLPETVDLGLSVKWASFNLGATAPEEYGDYYAWGETAPYYSSQDPLTWEAGKEYGYEWISYKWCKGSYNTLSKYCSMSSYGYNGFTDNKTVLDLEDDAAHVNLGGTWRMPTDAEFTELLNNCILEWALINGISGRKVTGPNGNSIFLPAPGLREGGSYINVGSCGYYWSSSLHADYPNSARLTSFDRGYLNREYYPRFYGLSVRPVCPKE